MSGVYHPCPMCGVLIPAGARYCDGCRPMAEQRRREAIEASRKRYEATRDPKYTRFYKSKAWRTISAAKLARQRECEARLDGCDGIACEVHHVKPLRTAEGWNERLEWGGLMSVCVRCHNKLDQKWGKATAPRDCAPDDGVIDLSKIK